MSDLIAQLSANPLSAAAARILGSLVEKQLTTPENYPLTLNALQLACNQSSNREPVLNLESGEILGYLRQLEDSGWVQLQMGSRADRWEHRIDKQLSLTPAQTSLLALLLLRGAQTVGELMTRSARLHSFDDLEQVRHTLERLASRELVEQLERQPGQRESRYQQRLTGPSESNPQPAANSSNETKEQRIASLENRLEELEARLAQLEQSLR